MLAKALSFTVAALLCLSATAAYAAQPPGGAADEYTEGVPGGGGETPSGDAGSGSGPQGDTSSSGDASVPATTESQLQSSGADGAAALSLIEETGPAESSPGNSKGPSSGSPGSPDKGATSPDRGSGGVAGVVNALAGDDSDGGLGVLLPIALIIVALGAAAVALARRGGSQPTG